MDNIISLIEHKGSCQHIECDECPMPICITRSYAIEEKQVVFYVAMGMYYEALKKAQIRYDWLHSMMGDSPIKGLIVHFKQEADIDFMTLVSIDKEKAVLEKYSEQVVVPRDECHHVWVPGYEIYINLADIVKTSLTVFPPETA